MIAETLEKTGLPVAYSHFSKKQKLPYIAYIGSGQNNFTADNKIFWRENEYQVELYFDKKNEELETTIEDILIEDGFLFEKSEDTYIDSENVFVIYYNVTKGKNDEE